MLVRFSYKLDPDWAILEELLRDHNLFRSTAPRVETQKRVFARVKPRQDKLLKALPARKHKIPNLM